MFEIKVGQVLEVHVSNGQDVNGTVTEIGDIITLAPSTHLQSYGEMHIPITGISYLRVMEEAPVKRTRKKR